MGRSAPPKAGRSALYFKALPNMFSSGKSLVLVIDVQGKLASLMFEKEKTFKNIQGIIKAARILDVPILWSEQLPQKIGSTIPEIAHLLKDLKPIVKSSFSCCGEKKFLGALYGLKRKQIIIVGIETHVCVYQTVTDMVESKYEVQMVADATSSRSLENKQYGLERIKEVGGQITSTEMTICELLKDAKDVRFKEILNLIK